MDKAVLKKVIKPLIKECLKEVLVEEGLVKVVNECTTPLVKQTLTNVPESKDFIRNLKKESVEKKATTTKDIKKIAASTLGFDLFEGTKPAPAEGESYEGEGVNIESLINENIGSWTNTLGISQRKKA